MLLLPGERSVFDLNAELEKGLAEKRREFWQKTPPAEALEQVRQDRRRAPHPTRFPSRGWSRAGRVDRDGYHIDKFVLHTDSGVPLPGLTYHPATPRADAYLYLHDGGKAADGAAGGPIEKLVREGYVVVAVDLRGTGETAGDTRAKPDALLGEWKSFYLAYLLGQPLVGLHTEDTIAAGQVRGQLQDQDAAARPPGRRRPRQRAGTARRRFRARPFRVGHAQRAGRSVVADRGAIGAGGTTDEHRPWRPQNIRSAGPDADRGP